MRVTLGNVQRVGPELWCDFSAERNELPKEFATLFGSALHSEWRGTYTYRIKLSDGAHLTPDFLLLGIACDWLRDAGWTVDLSKVVGWAKRLGG